MPGDDMTGHGGQGHVLVLQHLAAEGPGSIGDHLEAAGLQLTTVELDEGGVIPPLDDFDLLLVMGGPMDVWEEDLHPWLRQEKRAIRQWVSELGRPYIGGVSGINCWPTPWVAKSRAWPYLKLA
jgi:GMP synthase-like glutamine amidotransferase